MVLSTPVSSNCMNAPPEGDSQRLILCADDFGLTLATSQVIAALSTNGRLSAVSCMAGMPDWPASAPLLAPLAGSVDIGIHLTLTSEVPLTPMPRLAPGGRLPSLDRLMWTALARALPLDEIRVELAAQMSAFTLATGRAPDFVDAHQHFHFFPGLREIVLDLVPPGAWVRSCEDRWSRIRQRPFAGRALRSAFLCRGLSQAAAARGIRTNAGFTGSYDYRPDTDFSALFAGFLNAPGPVPLIMVHPGAADAPGDTIAAARTNEAAFLGNPSFPALLVERRLELSRGP
jgi:chitin disaccharide deacetylase